MTVIEVGYARDCDAAAKRAEKRAQHAELVRLLEAAGWRVQVVPVVLGHCGSVYGEDMKAVRSLGVDREAVRRLFARLHDNAVTYTCAAARAYQELRAERNRELGQLVPRPLTRRGGTP